MVACRAEEGVAGSAPGLSRDALTADAVERAVSSGERRAGDAERVSDAPR